MGIARVGVGIAVLLAACGRVGFDRIDGAQDDAVDGGPSDVRAIAAGWGHACAIRAGALSCWGSNASGEVGVGDTMQRLRATVVAPGSTWLAVAAGYDHTCAVRSDRVLLCWGANAQGQLGIGSTAPALSPTKVVLPTSVRSIHTKFDHTCAVLDDDSLWCWGDNAEGQLGQNDNIDRMSPAQVGIDLGWTQIATGQGHTIGIHAGALRGAGRNSTSELGQGTGATGQFRTMVPIDPGPWLRVTGGQNTSCGTRGDRSLWCWGSNVAGEAGFATLGRRDVPALVDSTEAWSEVAMFTFHGCGITGSGLMRCWGRNAEGQLGRGDTIDVLGPMPSGTFTDWTAISVGRFHSCGLRADASVWCTGENNDGSLGTGDLMRRNAWTEVVLP